MRRRLPVMLGLLLVLAFIGDQQCRLSDAVVRERWEGVDALIDPHWRPVHALTVHFTPDTTGSLTVPWQPDRWRHGVTASLPLARADYDRIAIEEVVRVRYLPVLPDVARLAHQSLAEVLLGPLLESLLASGLHWGIICLAWIILSARRGWWPGYFLDSPRKLIWLPVHLIMAQLLPLSLLGTNDLLPPPSGELRSATATIQEVREIRAVGHTRYGHGPRSLAMDLPQPYARVLVRFIPEGWRGTVIAVDDVSLATAAGLIQDDSVTVIYSVANPRDGRLEQATREHRWENRLFVHTMFTVPLLAFVVLGQLAGFALRLTAKRLQN